MTKHKKYQLIEKQKGVHGININIQIGFVALVLITVIAVAVAVPFAVIANTNVRKLQHYTCDSYSTNWNNPKIVHTTVCELEIEIYEPHLKKAGGDMHGDMWIVFGYCPEPVDTLQDWYDYGVQVDDFYTSGAAMNAWCSNIVGGYYTTFTLTWIDLPDLAEGLIYCIYVDFYNADSEFYNCPDCGSPFYGDGGFNIYGHLRPGGGCCDGLNVLIEDGFGDMDAGDVAACANFSFFIYEETTPPTTPPTTTPTTTPVGHEGNFGFLGNGWTGGLMPNWLFLILILLALSILLLLLFLLFKKKGKDKKKK